MLSRSGNFTFGKYVSIFWKSIDVGRFWSPTCINSLISFPKLPPIQIFILIIPNKNPFVHILPFYQAILKKLSVSYFTTWLKINHANCSLWFLSFLLIICVYILNLCNVRDFFFFSLNHFFCHVANRKKTTFWEWPYGQRMINYK